MILLSILYFLSSLILVVSSECTRNKPRKEGFLRSTCVPGFYEGSCLIILEKQSFHDAIDTCKYDYGGRLATAPTKDAIQIWIRTIYFNTTLKMDNDTRFWIGYGYNDQTELGFKYEKLNNVMKTYIDESIWNRVFGEPEKSASIHWENGADKIALGNTKLNYECPNYGVVFNPTNKKFDVKHFAEEHYSLCETPRWAKLQCDSEWQLIPKIRMCIKVHVEPVSFLDAHSTCKSQGSFIATAQDGDELNMIRSVIIPYKLPYKIDGHKCFWAGVKTKDGVTFSMDGTTSKFTAAQGDKCAANAIKDFCPLDYFGQESNEFCEDKSKWKSGYVTSCAPPRRGYTPLPFMCQKFADSSTVKNI